jgi:hypothetical protein
LGRAAAPFLIEPRLRRLFEFRHDATRRWCEGAEGTRHRTEASNRLEAGVARRFD